jgi:hypothetical protein
MKRRTAVILGLLAGILLAAVFREEPRLILFGWIPFLRRNLAAATVNPAGVASGIAAILLFLSLAHYFGRWWCAAAAGDPARRRWRFRWTLSLAILLLVGFAAGFATIGLARHVGWLLSSKQPVYVGHVDGRWEAD